MAHFVVVVGSLPAHARGCFARDALTNRKKTCWALFVSLLLVSSVLRGQVPASAQTVFYPVYNSQLFIGTGVGSAIFTGDGILSHTISWGTGGSGCTVTLQGASDTSFASPTPIIPTQSCSTAGTAQGPASGLAPWGTAFQYVRVSVSFTSGGQVQVTYFGYTANPSGTQNYGMPVVEGLGKYQTSNDAIYVSALNGGLAGCAAIDYALSNLSFQGQTVVVDLQGDQPCATNPIPTSCTSTVLIGSGANYHVQSNSSSQTAATWIIPGHCKVVFTGQASTTTAQAAASTISACQSGDATCGTNTFPTTGVVPLACFGNTTTCPATGTQMDSVIVGGTFDCEYVSGCIGIQNNMAQENSGVFGTAIVGWANAGTALSIGPAGNSTYEHLQINNTSTTTCTTTATGIRINAGYATGALTSFPRKISDVSITNNGCGSSGDLPPIFVHVRIRQL